MIEAMVLQYQQGAVADWRARMAAAIKSHIGFNECLTAINLGVRQFPKGFEDLPLALVEHLHIE
jgi:hypothetical protein